MAIITTASLVAPLLAFCWVDSDTAKAVVVGHRGPGAMVVSHANDSFFWVVTSSPAWTQTGYRLQTLGTLVQGYGGGGHCLCHQSDCAFERLRAQPLMVGPVAKLRIWDYSHGAIISIRFNEIGE